MPSGRFHIPWGPRRRSLGRLRIGLDQPGDPFPDAPTPSCGADPAEELLGPGRVAHDGAAGSAAGVSFGFGSADFLPAPTGALILDGVTVQTHQVGLEIPIGAAR